MMRQGLFFRCGKHGHLSRQCPSKPKGKGHNKSRINVLEEELKLLKSGAKKTEGKEGSSGGANGSKNGGARD
jgi:hypothetical protein